MTVQYNWVTRKGWCIWKIPSTKVNQLNSSNTGRTVQGQGRFILVYMVQVDELYTAMRTFDDILNDERNHIKIKMKPGDLVSLKNKAEEHLHKQNWLENLG